MHPGLRTRLEALYRELDRELLALDVTCRGCGMCCHFDVMEHILFATEAEATYLFERAGRGVPGHPQRCPYQAGSACRARSGRPLGCRLHFCELSPEQQLQIEALSARYHERLKVLHDEFGRTYTYRPLLALLDALRNPS